jgi:hypothetical protein
MLLRHPYHGLAVAVLVVVLQHYTSNPLKGFTLVVAGGRQTHAPGHADSRARGKDGRVPFPELRVQHAHICNKSGRVRGRVGRPLSSRDRLHDDHAVRHVGLQRGARRHWEAAGSGYPHLQRIQPAQQRSKQQKGLLCLPETSLDLMGVSIEAHQRDSPRLRHGARRHFVPRQLRQRRLA